ncbi:hypothetical protein Hdeb2414_s0018g00518951 [Helianthus debilis subsp. tardiflorus]
MVCYLDFKLIIFHKTFTLYHVKSRVVVDAPAPTPPHHLCLHQTKTQRGTKPHHHPQPLWPPPALTPPCPSPTIHLISILNKKLRLMSQFILLFILL